MRVIYLPTVILLTFFIIACSIPPEYLKRDTWAVHSMLGLEEYQKVVLDGSEGWEICGYLGDGNFVFSKGSNAIVIYNIVSNTCSDIVLAEGHDPVPPDIGAHQKVSLRRNQGILTISNINELFYYNIVSNTYRYLVKITNESPYDLEFIMHLLMDDQKNIFLLILLKEGPRYAYYLISNDTYTTASSDWREILVVDENGVLRRVEDVDIWVLEVVLVQEKEYDGTPFNGVAYKLEDYVLKNYKRRIEVRLRDVGKVEQEIVKTLRRASESPFAYSVEVIEYPWIFVTSDLRYMGVKVNEGAGFRGGKGLIYIGDNGYGNKWVLLDISSKTSGLTP